MKKAKRWADTVAQALLITLMLTPMASANEVMTAIDPADARRISRDAFLFGLPLVYIHLSAAVGSNVSEPQGRRAPANQFAHYRDFPDPGSREVVGPNRDTLYSFAWVDFSEQPLVLSVPKMGDRYWSMMVLDAWNDVPATPGSRTVGAKGGNFLIAGPDWRGEIPADLTVLRVASNIGAVAGRTYTTGTPDDIAAVHALQDQYILTPLSMWKVDYQPPVDVPVKPDLDMSTIIPAQVMSMSPGAFFNRLALLLVANPPRQADATTIAHLAKLGIRAGSEFKLSDFDPATQAAINAGYKDGWLELQSYRDKMGENINGWQVTYDLGRYGTQYAYRAAWTFMAIGGMQIEDALYPLAREDGDGQRLSGTHNYTLHFSQEQVPPVDAFWSLTVYDGESFLVDNPIDRYSLSSRDQMIYGEDGSLTIYLQQKSPGKDKEANWLPAPEGEIGFLALRLYVPRQQVIDRTWEPPPVKRSR